MLFSSLPHISSCHPIFFSGLQPLSSLSFSQFNLLAKHLTTVSPPSLKITVQIITQVKLAKILIMEHKYVKDIE